MDDVLVIQNSSAEGLGSLENLLVNDGFRLQNVFAKKEKIPQNDYSLLVVLGAPESANDNLDYLKNEMTLIRQFVKKETRSWNMSWLTTNCKIFWGTSFSWS